MDFGQAPDWLADYVAMRRNLTKAQLLDTIIAWADKGLAGLPQTEEGYWSLRGLRAQESSERPRRRV
jgi:hypothetical protein